jgi:protein-S-isoprenylcysteine O-methyltransferase Ste14
MPEWNRIARRIRVPAGFLFAGVYLWLAKPTLRSILLGSVPMVTGLMVRALASGHVKKNEELTIAGPYAYTRNPLYLGSLILALGFVLASRSWMVALIAFLLLVGIYLPVIRGEEQFLGSKFAEFDEYARAVPRIIPRLRPYRGSHNSFDPHLYWKHREYNAAIGAGLLIAALLAKIYLIHW